ncbi:hypothetical protein LLEC1_05755 [Akanthomyces lecanii]|uniref:Uncharacterized protein n=1 Tax=Cordyceps confragosa TaxID=2714763 RepID=A0A179IAE5_CORDF|nr:hypothetical protein LLEC1_05755 [Akanthomyces lecanii]
MAATNETSRGGDFGPVPATEESTRELCSLVHSHSRLQQAGYVLWSLGQADLNKKKRCGRCSKLIRKGHEKQKSRAQSVKLAPTMAQRIAAEYSQTKREEGQASMPAHARSVSLQETGADPSSKMRDMEMDKKDDNDGKDKGPPMNCRYHPGRVQYRASLTSLRVPPCGRNF